MLGRSNPGLVDQFALIASLTTEILQCHIHFPIATEAE